MSDRLEEIVREAVAPNAKSTRKEVKAVEDLIDRDSYAFHFIRVAAKDGYVEGRVVLYEDHYDDIETHEELQTVLLKSKDYYAFKIKAGIDSVCLGNKYMAQSKGTLLTPDIVGLIEDFAPRLESNNPKILPNLKDKEALDRYEDIYVAFTQSIQAIANCYLQRGAFQYEDVQLEVPSSHKEVRRNKSFVISILKPDKITVNFEVLPYKAITRVLCEYQQDPAMLSRKIWSILCTNSSPNISTMDVKYHVPLLDNGLGFFLPNIKK